MKWVKVVKIHSSGYEINCLIVKLVTNGVVDMNSLEKKTRKENRMMGRVCELE